MGNKTGILKRIKELNKKRKEFYNDAEKEKRKWIDSNYSEIEAIQKEEEELLTKLKELDEKKPKKSFLRLSIDYGNTNSEGLEIVEEIGNYVLCYKKGYSSRPTRVSGVVYSSPAFLIFDNQYHELFSLEYKRGERKQALQKAKDKLKSLIKNGE